MFIGPFPLGGGLTVSLGLVISHGSNHIRQTKRGVLAQTWREQRSGADTRAQPFILTIGPKLTEIWGFSFFPSYLAHYKLCSFNVWRCAQAKPVVRLSSYFTCSFTKEFRRPLFFGFFDNCLFWSRYVAFYGPKWVQNDRFWHPFE